MEAVAGTANSAAISKRSAAAFGYVSDEFAGWFDRSSVKCAPIINRGTYVRVAAIDSICEQFAPARADAAGGEPAPPRQILSLGAGLDTRPWRMRRAGTSLSRYVEVDLPCVCERKRQLLLKKGGAPPRLPGLAEDGGAADTAGSNVGTANTLSPLAAADDALVCADLADIDSLLTALASARFDPKLPTLVLIECVLVYMEPAAGSALLAFLAAHLPDAACLAYDMIRPDDAFGRQMVSNLEGRGLRIPGISGCADTNAHEARFAACGWRGCKSVDMVHWYERELPRVERQRVERLEWLDEVEEWRLLLSHYCFVLAHTPGAEREGGWASTLMWMLPATAPSSSQAATGPRALPNAD